MTKATPILAIKAGADLREVTSAIMAMVRQAHAEKRPIEAVVAEHLNG